MNSEVKTRVTSLSEVGPTEDGDDCVVIIYSPDAAIFGKRQVLGSESLRIGRERGNHIVLQSDSVSRRHCVMESRGTDWVVRDLGSTNGTYVNDRFVRECQLRSGDEVKVGDTIFRYLSGSHVEAQYHETIYRMMITDGLTNVPNKRYLMEALEKEMSRARRYERPLAVLMLDLDHFKRVNDTFGHIAGDYVLKEAASVISGRLRPDDLLARYGGEEFCVLLPETELEGAALIAETLRQRLETHPFVFDGETIQVTTSIGCAQVQENETPIQLIQSADKRLYEAKNSTRNCVCS